MGILAFKKAMSYRVIVEDHWGKMIATIDSIKELLDELSSTASQNLAISNYLIKVLDATNGLAQEINGYVCPDSKLTSKVLHIEQLASQDYQLLLGTSQCIAKLPEKIDAVNVAQSKLIEEGVRNMVDLITSTSDSMIITLNENISIGVKELLDNEGRISESINGVSLNITSRSADIIQTTHAIAEKVDAAVSEISQNTKTTTSPLNTDKIIDYIQKVEDQYTMAYLALQKYPFSVELLKFYSKVAEERLSKSQDISEQRGIVLDMGNAVTLFTNACSLLDLEQVSDIADRLRQYSKDLAPKLKDAEEKNIEAMISNLQDLLKQSSGFVGADDLFKQIQTIDSKIRQDRLMQYPQLLAKYKELMNQTQSKLLESNQAANRSNNNAKINQYNSKAIKAHEAAYLLFSENTGFWESDDYKQGRKLHDLVEHLGGWDNQYLLSSTMAYMAHVYSYIFAKMTENAKVALTKQMAAAKTRSLE